jgi:hypothetical protein
MGAGLGERQEEGGCIGASLGASRASSAAVPVVCWWPFVWQNASSSGASVHDPSGISVRGGTGERPMRWSQWLIESMGGSPAAAARWSVGSAPAMPSTNVAYLGKGGKGAGLGERQEEGGCMGASLGASRAYQSHAVMSSSEVVPRTAGGSAPPETNAFTRTPPCQFECFPPFSGKLLAEPRGPPLLLGVVVGGGGGGRGAGSAIGRIGEREGGRAGGRAGGQGGPLTLPT